MVFGLRAPTRKLKYSKLDKWETGNQEECGALMQFCPTRNGSAAALWCKMLFSNVTPLGSLLRCSRNTVIFNNSVNRGGQILLEWEQINGRLSEKCVFSSLQGTSARNQYEQEHKPFEYPERYCFSVRGVE